MALAQLGGDDELPRIQRYPRSRSRRKNWEVAGEVLARRQPAATVTPPSLKPRVNMFIGTFFNDQLGINLMWHCARVVARRVRDRATSTGAAVDFLSELEPGSGPG